MTNFANAKASPSSFSLDDRNTQQCGITELVISNGHEQYLQWLLPMVAHFSHQDDNRWLTWIGANGISKQLLKRYDINTRNLRLIHLKQSQDTLWTSWDALAQGNSHMVIANPGVLNNQQQQQLQKAAELGSCQGLMLRFRH